jgi:hypothetical protein
MLLVVDDAQLDEVLTGVNTEVDQAADEWDEVGDLEHTFVLTHRDCCADRFATAVSQLLA